MQAEVEEQNKTPQVLISTDTAETPFFEFKERVDDKNAHAVEYLLTDSKDLLSHPDNNLRMSPRFV